MEEHDFEVAVKAVEKMIKDTLKEKDEAIEKEDWSRANNMDHYASGLDQALCVFKMS